LAGVGDGRPISTSASTLHGRLAIFPAIGFEGQKKSNREKNHYHCERRDILTALLCFRLGFGKDESLAIP
jgi:hypothetical protein